MVYKLKTSSACEDVSSGLISGEEEHESVSVGALPSDIICSSPYSAPMVSSACGSAVETEDLDERVKRAIEEMVKGAEEMVRSTPYSDSLYAHLERAKGECLRSKIEADTVIIDRGIAVSEGAGHAKMVLGLKVKYAKKGSLPMGASFVMLKAEGDKEDKGSKGCGEKEHAPEEDAKAGDDKAEGWSRVEPEKKAEATEAVETAEEKCPGSVDPYGMFISYTMSGGAPGLININHVVDAYNEYVTRYGAKEWSALALIMDVPDYDTIGTSMGPRVIRIEDPGEAKKAWESLARASRGKF